MDKCVFCQKLGNKKPVLENGLIAVYYDEYPVNKGHMLFITKRHCETFFDMTKEEKESMFNLVDEAKIMLDKEYQPDGYNIGFNCGKTAGQTIMHTHLHLIPRYDGDVKNPKGGIRGVIPSKQNY